MPTPNLDAVLREDLSRRDAAVGEARRDLNWVNQFSGERSDAALRASRNLTQLTNDALDRKAQLLATVDKNAQDIYIKQREFQEWEQQAPLRDQLLRTRIEAEGATAKFQAFKDAQTNEHVAGFLNYMMNAPDESDARFDNYARQGMAKFHRVVGTEVGKDVLSRIAQGREIAKQLQDITAPDGTELSSVTFGKTGSPQQVTFRSVGEDKSLDDETKAAFGVPVSVLRNPVKAESGNVKDGTFTPANAGTHFRVEYLKDGNSETVTLPRAQYERLGLPVGEKDRSTPPVAEKVNITQEEYEKLKPGDTYNWGGKILTKK